MRRKIRKLISLLIFLLIVYIGYMAIFKPDELKVTFSNVSIKIFKEDIFTEENERINDVAIIKSKDSKNKDYSNSIKYPYYELLSDSNKKLYNQLIDGVKRHDINIDVMSNVKKSDMGNIFNSIMNDHPEFFWVDSHLSYSIDANNDVVSVNMKYKYNKEDTDNKIKEIDKIVSPIIEEANNKKLDYEKEKYVHDTLIKYLEYDGTKYEEQDIYSALTSKKAVCAGYVRAFQYIMMEIGIPTYYIEGYADEDHAWALVELEDGFYNVDITWDDQVNRIIYKYFNVSEELISKDHRREGLSEQIVKANGTKYENIYTTLKKD